MKLPKMNPIRLQVYELLKEEICSGAYRPGQRLQEMELAERLKVSRSPVREALRLLSADGLVEELPNKGVFVREYTPKDIGEIYDLRVLLESYAIDRLARTITQPQAEGLLELLQQMEVYHRRKDMGGYIRLDRELHTRIVHLCGNDMMTDLYERLNGQIARFRQYSLASEIRFEESMDEHRNIIHSLIQGNSRQAQDTNLYHLTHARDKVMEFVAVPPEQR